MLTRWRAMRTFGISSSWRGRLVVETEPLPFMTDRMNARGNVNEPARTLCRARRLPGGVVDRIGRVLREGVQDIGEQQFLVLLLVMQADLQNREDARRVRRRHLLDQPLDRRIDMGAIAGDVRAVRPGDQAALRAGVARPGGDVIGVEQERKTLIENLVAGIVRHQQELLEEPGDVGAVPFCRGWRRPSIGRSGPRPTKARRAFPSRRGRGGRRRARRRAPSSSAALARAASRQRLAQRAK